MTEMTRRFPTRTFFDIYEVVDDFKSDLQALGNSVIKAMTDDQINDLYMHIAGTYGDSYTRYTNEKLFSIKLFNEINDFWPRVLSWQRDQARLRDANITDFQLGGKTVQNAGAHNTADVSTDTMEGINQLDAQTIVNSQRGELGVLQERLEAYKAGEEDKFLRRLVPLFIQIIAPMADLLYGTEAE